MSGDNKLRNMFGTSVRVEGDAAEPHQRVSTATALDYAGIGAEGLPMARASKHTGRCNRAARATTFEVAAWPLRRKTSMNVLAPAAARWHTPTEAAPAGGAQEARRAARAYRLRLARSADDVRAAQALRFTVFNLELREGLARSFETGRDADGFDSSCDHLLVETGDGTVVGTYRLQTGARAASCDGYYSAHEFDFAPYEPLRGELIELGRACIDATHRNFAVLNLLWKGIAAYAAERQARYLIGCSSLNTLDPAVGAAAYQRLQPCLAPPELRTRPLPAHACPLHDVAAEAPKIPKLLSAYLALGATICAPPAIDRSFKTIDFLTLIDLHSSGVAALQRRGRFGGAAA
jgi:putative hemolysin